MNYKAVVEARRSLVTAPAGYGKTYSIAKCLEFTIGRSLILTHTHAGVTSIKNKIRDLKIPSSKYSVETISSFAQRYVRAYYSSGDMPPQEDKNYHPFIVAKAANLFCLDIIKDVVRASYCNLFVDEYQDCTSAQHRMIQKLGDVISIHIFGDELQGIFAFGGEDMLVNFAADLKDFTDRFELKVPFRWLNYGKPELGDSLDTIRTKLLAHEPIDLSMYAGTHFHVMHTSPNDFSNANSKYRKGLRKLIDGPEYGSLLLLCPVYTDCNKRLRGQITDRVRIKAQLDYSNTLSLMEAIDDRTFYSLADNADNLIARIGRANKKYLRIREDILSKLFGKTKLQAWICDDKLITKQNANNKIIAEKLDLAFEVFFKHPTSLSLLSLIDTTRVCLSVRCQRNELFTGFRQALRSASVESITVLEAMKAHRDLIRRAGGRQRRRCIGSTLLTKGLEFDTVAVLDAHLFGCRKNLYVALTRCRERLVVFSENLILEPS